MLIVVDHDPGVVRAIAKVLREHLGEERRLPLWVLGCRESLQEPATGARDAGVGRRDESTSDYGDVDRRPAGPEPADGAALRPAHCSQSVVFPYPDSATSSRTWAVGPLERRGSTGALDDPAPADRRLPWLVCHWDCCGEPTPRASAGEGRARGRCGRAAGACRQRLRGGRSLTRAGTYGSSPVSWRNAAGIWRRRGTPSFTRRASLCAFAVRAEIPSERPTSSFEHPAAINATTSRGGRSTTLRLRWPALVMARILPSLDRGIHSSAGVNPGVTRASLGSACATPAVIAVVGAGIAGAATADALSRREALSVVLLEQFDLGHTRGSSHGSSRIFRLNYPDESFVRFAQSSDAAWRGLEEEHGERLIERVGSLDLGPAAEDVGRALAACGVRFEALTAHDVRTRWPIRIDDGETAVFQPDGGSPTPIAHTARFSTARSRGASTCGGARPSAL